MDEELYERIDSFSVMKCPNCRKDMAVELHFGRKHGRLHVHQEALCGSCGNKVSVPMPEGVIVVDAASIHLLAN